MTKILVVDDEKKIVEIVRAYLEREGYEVSAAYDGKSALEAVKRMPPDLVVLDLMLPQISGWDVCRALRRTSNIPIIMLTARDEDADKLIGLELGADDYVTKPFSPREVVARVRAVLRRARGGEPSTDVVRVHDLEIDPVRFTAIRDGRALALTPTEFKLLLTLAAHPGRAFTRLQLIDQVQGYAFEGYERTVDAHIKNLRQKLEPAPHHPCYVLTVHGVGYRMAEHLDLGAETRA